MRIGVISLGCPRNLVDTEVMTGILEDKGYSIAEGIEKSDIVLVNTCAFIKDAIDESLDTIFSLVELKKKGKIKHIVVAGCLAQRYKGDLRSELKDVDGFIVQLPLPGHINEEKVIEAIDFGKDVDGFHPVNVGRMVIGLPSFISATPFGIIELLKRYKIETSGKNCVIVGRSNIVGRPLSILMSQKSVNATVTVAHSRTKDLGQVCASADILIAALGSPEFIKANMVKDGAVVIDVGTTRVPSTETRSGFRLKGDVKYDEVAPKCAYITPVPGGVGPMTRVSLLSNTLLAAKGNFYTTT